MRKRDYPTTILSEVFHYITFSCKQPLANPDMASLIMTIDIDVGNAEVAQINKGSNDRNVHDFLTESTVGRVEEKIVPILLQVFDDLELPATFAVRGQSTEVDNSIINLILETSTRHEIAAHGYSHKVFTSLSQTEAERELTMVSNGMKKFGIVPKSFVFPKNKVSHLSLLDRFGYLSFRGHGDFLTDGMYVRKSGNLYDVHPSLYLEFVDAGFLMKIIDLAVMRKRPLHFWFHAWNLGYPEEVAARKTKKVLIPLIKHAKEKKTRGVLKFETMCSIVEKYQHSLTICR